MPGQQSHVKGFVLRVLVTGTPMKNSKQEAFIDHAALARYIAIIRGLNLPESENHAARRWAHVFYKLVECMQWPLENWNVVRVSHQPSDTAEENNGLVADVEFRCNGVSVVASIGLFMEPTRLGHIRLAFEQKEPVVDVEHVDLELQFYRKDSIEPTPLGNVIKEMADQIQNHIIGAAWKVGKATAK